MKLTPEQREQFDRDGYLFFPSLFTPQETAALNAAVPELYSRREAYNVRERGSDAVRTNFAAHMYSAPFARLARHPRMIEPVEELFGEQLYMHQFKINGKMAFEGDVWQWHQDYGTWKRDGMPEARPTTALVMLDEPTEMNGCLYFIPGSHKEGSLEPEFNEATGYKFYVTPKDKLLEIMARSPEPVAITGKPGTVVFFDCNILHASGHNLSQHNRWAIYVVYNPVTNRCRDVPNPRPDYVRSTNTKPLIMGSEHIFSLESSTQEAR